MKVPIIYIASNGRSGSTILDLMLGSFPNLWTLGEAQLLPLELNFNARCGNGQAIKDSEFWKELLRSLKFEDEVSKVSYFRKSHPHGSHTGSVIRRKELFRLFTRIRSKKVKKRIQHYGELNADYFQKVLAHAKQNRFADNIDWLVDASKDPYRLMWLQESGLFNIKVIHLVKKPPAFVYSTARYQRRKVNLMMVGRMTVRWMVENMIITEVCKRCIPSQNLYTLQYEELVQNPGYVLASVGDKFGIDLQGYETNRLREYENFGISGNKSRWENKTIYLDEKWKEHMPPHYIRFVNWCTKKLAIKYGYEAVGK